MVRSLGHALLKFLVLINAAEYHQRYFFVNEIDTARRPTWTNPLLIEQRSAREPNRRVPSSGQSKKGHRPAFSEHTASRIVELPSSNVSEDETKSLSPRLSPSSQGITSETLEPDALELSPVSDHAIEKSSSSHAAVDGNEEYGLLPRRKRTDHSSESIKENLSPPSPLPRRERLNAHDTVMETPSPGLKPDFSGPSVSPSHQPETSGPDQEDHFSAHGSVISNYDWRSEPPLKERPGLKCDAYECQPLRPEDDYMMSGALGPASPVRSPTIHAEERGRRRLSPHKEGIETHFPTLEGVTANDPPPEGQSGADNEETAHITIAEPEKPVHEARKPRGRSLSKTMDRIRDHWQNYQDKGKYPMNRHRSMKYTKKSQARSRALQDSNSPPEDVSTFETEPLRQEPLQYQPLPSEPLQSEPYTTRAKPRVAQSHSPPPTRSQGRRTRVSKSHSPSPHSAESRHAGTDQFRSSSRPSNTRLTRSEERQDPGVQPPWMPNMTGYEGSEGARYYWLDPEVIAEKEREAKYKKLEAEAARNHWKTNFRAKPYKKTKLPIAA